MGDAGHNNGSNNGNEMVPAIGSTSNDLDLPSGCGIEYYNSNHINSLQRHRMAAATLQLSHLVHITNPLQHCESPIWDTRSNMLYFVDFDQQLVNQFDFFTGMHSFIKLGEPVTFATPVSHKLDYFVVGCGRSMLLLKWDGQASQPSIMRSLFSLDPINPKISFGPGKADVAGQIWAGTAGPVNSNDPVNGNEGALYRFDIIKIMAKVHLRRVDIINGMAWSQNNEIFYYVNSAENKIDAFDFDLVQGSITNSRCVFHLTRYRIEGRLAGMTIDTDDNLWIAVFNGGKVIKVDPQTGKLLRTIQIPVKQITSLTFGGPNLDVLFVTTSQSGLPMNYLQSEPLAGCVFCVTGLGVRGLKPNTVVCSQAL